MSANIKIQEGGKDRGFTAEKLKTALAGGGEAAWVRKDERQLTTKSVNQNGEYRAASDGKYGYSSFTATVTDSGSVTGKGQDGKEYNVHVESGDLVETLLPSEIAVTLLPTTNIYRDGDAISLAGIQVTAYDADGDVWTGDGQYPDGVIPVNELLLPVGVAIYDESTAVAGTAYMEDTTGLDPRTIAAMPFIYDFNVIGEGIYNTGTKETGTGPGMDITQHGSKPVYVYTEENSIGNKSAYACSEEYFEGVFKTYNQYGNYETSIRADRFEKLGKTYYQATLASGGAFFSVSPPPNYVGEDAAFIEISYVILFGLHTPSGSVQTVIIQWARPGDGKILETSFDIIVSQSA